uniref:Ig-like domain-containing protein n=1 Tax=Scleropages formosus TaxID=113540 RepID=A0A8C9RA71_SCLFO
MTCIIHTPSKVLHCEQDDSSYLYMYWYKQTTGAMDLLAYSLGEGSVTTEPPFNESKYEMGRPEVLKSSLKIKNLDPGDSAVYFCASSMAH